MECARPAISLEIVSERAAVWRFLRQSRMDPFTAAERMRLHRTCRGNGLRVVLVLLHETELMNSFSIDPPRLTYVRALPG
jgi:hypothetical protein